MPTARERQVCSKQQHQQRNAQPNAALVGINASGELLRLELHSNAPHSSEERIPTLGQQCSSEQRPQQQCGIYFDSVGGDFPSPSEVDNNNNESNRLCSAAIQCSFCRWQHHYQHHQQQNHDRSATNRSAADQFIGTPRSMDSEEQWCGRLIRDQHGVYGKLTPVFREHFNNRRKTSVDDQTPATTAILNGGDARNVAMETTVMEGVGAANEQQRNMILAAQLSGLSLAERRLAVAPRITLTSFDGDCSSNDEGSPRQHQQRANGDGSADAGPCLSARSQNDSPLSPNFLAVPQLQEVGKERRPAPMVV